MDNGSSDSLTDASVFACYLVSQVGHYAAQRFAQLLEPDGLAPVDAGILRIIASNPGISQQELASLLKVFPSKLVHLLDLLEGRGLVTRQCRPIDRRVKGLTLTGAGLAALETVHGRTVELEKELFSQMTRSELSSLIQSLQRVAGSNGLFRNVHPHYQDIQEESD